MTSLKIYAFILETVRLTKPFQERIASRNWDLGDQLHRSMTSVPLNTAEGAYRNDGNQRERFKTAMGSANESAGTLQTGEVLGYVGDVSALVDRWDRIARTLNKLARGS